MTKEPWEVCGVWKSHLNHRMAWAEKDRRDHLVSFWDDQRAMGGILGGGRAVWGILR